MKRFISLLLCVILVFSLVGTVGTVYAEGVLFGDSNDDGVVDMKDFLLMRKRLAGKVSKSDINLVNSDINGIYGLTTIDANLLMLHLVKKQLLVQSDFYTMDQLDSCMSLYGRAVMQGSDILLSQTASGFKFTANCEGSMYIRLATEKEGKIDITVDDDLNNIYTIDVSSSQSLYLAELGLEKGEHTILIQKATEHTQNSLITVNAIAVSGEFGTEKPKAKAHKIEFYGDSITSGYGNLTNSKTSNAGSWSYQDGVKTYATYTANALDADYAVASASGHGVLGGYDDYIQLYSKYFNYSIVSTQVPWSRADYDADLIVINFGSNDDSREGNNLDQTTFEAECQKIIDEMVKDNPDVQILWVIGMNLIESDHKILTYLQNVADNNENVKFFSTSAACSGGENHPTVAEHKSHAEKLVNFIKQNYPTLFGDVTEE